MTSVYRPLALGNALTSKRFLVLPCFRLDSSFETDKFAMPLVVIRFFFDVFRNQEMEKRTPDLAEFCVFPMYC